MNILFDLGHVIVDIDFSRTQDALLSLGWDTTEVEALHKPAFLDLFEIGRLEESAFYDEMRAHLQSAPDDQAILQAWNAMLLGIRPETMTLLHELSQRYNLYIFSNTNVIHARWIDMYLKEHFDSPTWPEGLFDGVYYSQDIGHRKPAEGGFHFIHQDAKIIPEETLFIDDLLPNLNTARQLGHPILHKHPSRDLRDLLVENGVVK